MSDSVHLVALASPVICAHERLSFRRMAPLSSFALQIELRGAQQARKLRERNAQRSPVRQFDPHGVVVEANASCGNGYFYFSRRTPLEGSPLDFTSMNLPVSASRLTQVSFFVLEV
jgi:hypothetical protein